MPESSPASRLLEDAGTWIELLRRRARGHPERRALTFLADGEKEGGSLSYGELDRQARVVATLLQRRGLGGQRLLLIHPPGLEFAAHFFGCLYAGAVPVPIPPPRTHRPPTRVQAVGTDAGAVAVLSTQPLLQRSPALTSLASAASWALLTTEDLAGIEPSAWQPPQAAPGDLAFLQYTSGSTAEPRGVRVTHGNLLANAAIIAESFDLSEGEQVVSWLPHFHDMGLVGALLQSLACGGHCVLMPPTAFVQRPLRWLTAVSRYRATVSGGPNFAYELCLRQVSAEAVASLDLSCWRVAFCGAEVVRAATLEQFSAAFRPCRFPAEAFYPNYGLAEATLLVTGGTVREPPVVVRFSASALEQNRAAPAAPGERATALVGCGPPRPSVRLVVVDPETRRRCGPGAVGEIWLAGPAVAAGYWNRPAETERCFGAELDPSDGTKFLRTGDLGALHDGELFITGRLKDLIILNGRNVHPEDLEASAERSHPSLSAGGCAAFSVDDGEGERLLLLGEVLREQVRSLPAAVVASRVRQAVWEEHELRVHGVVLLRPGSFPRTSSGKPRRHACRTAFRNGTLEGILHTSLLPGPG